MMYHLFKFNGVFSLLLFTTFRANKTCSYADQATCFISAYSQGLSGPEAVWVNQKYHGHQTLSPNILTKLRQEYKTYLA